MCNYCFPKQWKAKLRTKTEARDNLRALRKELETGVKSAARYAVADAVTDWLERGLKGRSEETVKKNTHLAKAHVIPALGKAKLRDLTADDVDDWLESKETPSSNSHTEGLPCCATESH